jgi:Sec-independent protein translocase protein TatA
LGGALGRGIRDFRAAMQSEEAESAAELESGETSDNELAA